MFDGSGKRDARIKRRGSYVTCNADCLHLRSSSSEVGLKQYGFLCIPFPSCFAFVFACA
jgi:hypothetical protein